MTGTDSIADREGCCHYFGQRAVDPDYTRFVVGLAMLLVLLILGAVRLPWVDGADWTTLEQDKSYVTMIEASDSRAVIDFLRSEGMWEMDAQKPLPPLVFTSFPVDMGQLRASTRKRLFLHTLAPTAMVALAEVAHERAELLRVVGRMDFAECTLEKLIREEVSYQDCGLVSAEADFLRLLSAKYRTARMDVLLNRVNVIPLSLVLAQAAMESAWGGSRFVQEGNNIFGVWTWGSEGMVPANRAPGMTHRVAIYDSLLDSVRAYLLMLNRVSAYSTLREIRRESMDSLALVNGLRYYSEKRERYVDDLRRLIKTNQMQRYDILTISLEPAEVQKQLSTESFRQTRLD
ncbi:glucosaminidase domain-containing protein [Desulfurivibrio dismutans]|uniref:glucosaminidase domain-containing protein n=1 Tax=Desulfurivibrio dismutans TaxID=1398908 RepID=UPI0023DB700E|nr:glucosaminidase domain-containing protein [Desulfurivibrio alkaliphilus]MDF1614878.1 glucosaminidase domain-containing protein [Desulfurivibrio alkaliphilus]